MEISASAGKGLQIGPHCSQENISIYMYIDAQAKSCFTREHYEI